MIKEFDRVKIISSGIFGVVVDIYTVNGETFYTVESEEREESGCIGLDGEYKLLKVITGDSFKTDRGLIVVCDPECINGIVIPAGEHVIYEGKEYVIKGVVQSSTMIDEWMALLVEA